MKVVYPPVNCFISFPELKNSKRKDTHTMRKDNLNGIKKPERFIDDPITQVLQKGASKLLAKALEVEINSFLEHYSGLLDDQGKKRITRNGYLPERDIQTGIGPVRVRAPRACDRKGENGKNKIKFASPYVSG